MLVVFLPNCKIGLVFLIFIEDDVANALSKTLLSVSAQLSVAGKLVNTEIHPGGSLVCEPFFDEVFGSNYLFSNVLGCLWANIWLDQIQKLPILSIGGLVVLGEFPYVVKLFTFLRPESFFHLVFASRISDVVIGEVPYVGDV